MCWFTHIAELSNQWKFLLSFNYTCAVYGIVSCVHRVRFSFNAFDCVCELAYIKCKVTLSDSARFLNLLYTLLHTSETKAIARVCYTPQHAYTNKYAHTYERHLFFGCMHAEHEPFMYATCKNFMSTEMTNTTISMHIAISNNHNNSQRKIAIHISALYEIEGVSLALLLLGFLVLLIKCKALWDWNRMTNALPTVQTKNFLIFEYSTLSATFNIFYWIYLFSSLIASKIKWKFVHWMKKSSKWVYESERYFLKKLKKMMVLELGHWTCSESWLISIFVKGNWY